MLLNSCSHLVLYSVRQHFGSFGRVLYIRLRSIDTKILLNLKVTKKQLFRSENVIFFRRDFICVCFHSNMDVAF